MKKKSVNKKILLLVIIFLLWVFPRILNLGSILTADEPTWIDRSHNFLKALSNFELEQTRQYRVFEASHPGVTTMWLGSFGIILSKVAKIFFSIPYKVELFLIKAPIVVFSGLIFVFVILLLSEVVKWPLLLLIGSFIALDPFLIAYGRLIHLDGLLSILMFASLVSLLIGLQKDRREIIIVSGILTGLALLTKVPAFSLLPLSVLLVLILSGKKSISLLLSWLIALVITFIMFWPAMWVKPIESLMSLFRAAQSGTTVAHGRTEYILNPLFYPRTLLYFVPPLYQFFVLVSFVFLFIKTKAKNKWLLFISFLFIFYFVFGMTLGAKKGERYILPVYPFIGLLAGFGAYHVLSSFKKLKGYFFPYFVLIGYLILNVVLIHPYYLSFYNPLLPEPEKIGFGEGLEKAAYYLNEKDNSESLIVSSWYSGIFGKYFNGKTFDLKRRDDEVHYVVLYRGMKGRADEDPATKILQEFAGKEPEKTIYINNLEYVWIYKK